MLGENQIELLIKNISLFITQLFNEKLPSWAVYHDLSHTIDTVNACEEIGKGSGLSIGDLELLYIAAWFHDAGYLFQVENHEEKSSEIASNFLKSNEYPLDRLNRVINCIMATKVAIQPKDLMQSVICDADLISLGSVDCFKKNDLLKSETEQRENKKISELAWLQRSLGFLSSHKYYTEYAQNNFGPQLKANIKILQKKIDEYT